MPLHSFESRASVVPAPAVEHGPILECSPPAAESSAQILRIRARRLYTASGDEVFAAWTSRMAWDSWMRLRARSRALVAGFPGGAFRLELAEGPTIHVVIGTFVEVHRPDRLKFTWQHQHAGDNGSTVDVMINTRLDRTELTLIHTNIGSRREAAWLMRLWSRVLRRLSEYLAEPDGDHETLSDPSAPFHAGLKRCAGGSLAIASGGPVLRPSSRS